MRQRILVAEDDAMVRRFIAVALQELGAEVLECDSVDGAIALLQAQPVQLVFTDLSFPERSGLELIKWLAQGAGQGHGPRIVVFSGGLHAGMREQLMAMGVWRCLSKPATLSEIASCARQGLGFVNWPEAPEANAPVPPSLLPHELAAIETYFSGDRVFYESFRVSCIKQFASDLSVGDQACSTGDAAVLRRTVHGLKSVLQTLGYADHSMCARALEETVQSRPWIEVVAGWRALRERMADTFGLH